MATGIAAVSAAGVMLLKSILPGLPPIEVHDLHYDAGVIYQDRTVRTDEPAFFAYWTAKIVRADTGEPVPWCAGYGSWAYEPGRATYPLPLPEWVGNPACTVESLNPGIYRPVAVWSWGDDQTSHEGEPFTVP